MYEGVVYSPGFGRGRKRWKENRKIKNHRKRKEAAGRIWLLAAVGIIGGSMFLAGKALAETGPAQERTGEAAQPVDAKVMYLTFDDGPYPESTDRILDILKERNIKAAFFVVGENVRRNPEVARRIAAEGHTIGIHCNSHDYHALYQSTDSYVRDFEEAYAAVKEVTGVEAEIFRFPGGSINAYNKSVSKKIAEEMTHRGFVYFDWNASLEDAVREPQKENLIANALETPLGRRKVVMLAHDTVDTTADCLEEILDGLAEYKMEQLTSEVSPIQFRQ